MTPIYSQRCSVLEIIVNFQKNETAGMKQISEEHGHDNLSGASIKFIQNKVKLHPFYTMSVSIYILSQLWS